MKVNCPTDQQIRQRAHDIFVQNGREPGHEVDNWLQAEYELMQMPVRKIAELEPPKSNRIRTAYLVSFVHWALLLGANELTHLKR